MTAKRFNFWIDEADLKELKKKAEQERRSLANYIKNTLFKNEK